MSDKSVIKHNKKHTKCILSTKKLRKIFMLDLPFYMRWWFWILICGIIVGAILNLVYAWQSNSQNNANFYTAISGWISGLATAVLGIIAIRVSQNLSKKQNALSLFEKQFNTIEKLKKLLKEYKISNNIIGLYSTAKNDKANQFFVLASGHSLNYFYISFLPHSEKQYPLAVFDVFDEYISFFSLAVKIFDEDIKTDLNKFIDEFKKLREALLYSLTEQDSANIEKAITDYNNAEKNIENEKVIEKMEEVIEKSYYKGIK